METNVALLGYGTVGAAVDRLLTDSADDIERATGHRLRVVKALVRDRARERAGRATGIELTTEFAEIAEDASIAVVAATHAPGEIGELAERKDVVTLHQRHAVLEVEALSDLHLVSDGREHGGAFQQGHPATALDSRRRRSGIRAPHGAARR